MVQAKNRNVRIVSAHNVVHRSHTEAMACVYTTNYHRRGSGERNGHTGEQSMMQALKLQWIA